MNRWIKHVMAYAKKNKVTFHDALTLARPSYHKESKTRPGQLDFTTKKTSKVYHEKGHRVVKAGKKPYRK
jgi:hypothetical protein